VTWALHPLEPARYRAIVADPPWPFVLRSERGAHKSPSRHYRAMSWQRLATLPVGALAAERCALFLWACAPSLPHALACLQGWGFRYVTGGAWAKTTPSGRLVFPTGYVWRGTAEFLLVGAIGAPRWASRRERNLIVAERREHSRKPDAVYGLVERLIPSGPYAELFARQRRQGWDAFGDELGKFRSAEA
jgi:N6-adenosine-specific RNA methylase IME4